jgi:hypothetical protein
MARRLFVVEGVTLIESKGLVVSGYLAAPTDYPHAGDHVEVRRRDGSRVATTVTGNLNDPRWAEVMLRGFNSTADIAVGDEVWAPDA